MYTLIVGGLFFLYLAKSIQPSQHGDDARTVLQDESGRSQQRYMHPGTHGVDFNRQRMGRLNFRTEAEMEPYLETDFRNYHKGWRSSPGDEGLPHGMTHAYGPVRSNHRARENFNLTAPLVRN